jgi:ubiquinone/menaquinone biosynthesis C-methylase UbiE
MNLRECMGLLFFYRRRLNSYEDYVSFQRYQAKLVNKKLESNNITFAGQRILDLGSGLGGYALEWNTKGGWVCPLDLSPPSPAVLEAGIPALRGSAQRLPLKTGAFDIIFCASLIEHIPDPKRVLCEIYRVLSTGGICYLSFPPFYSLRGGHEFSPYHYLGERLALKLSRRNEKITDIPWIREHYSINTSAESFSDTFENWGLYRVTIYDARKWIKEIGFDIIDFGPRYMSLNLAGIPVLGEVLTWHVQFILRK